MSGKSQHVLQAERLARLGVSHRSAAKDLRLPASTLGFYLTRGRLTARLKSEDVRARLDRYIENKEQEARRGRGISSAPIAGKFYQLGVKFDKLSDLLDLPRDLLVRGIRAGIWPDEPTRDRVAAWIDKRLSESEGKKMITKISLSEECLAYYHLPRDPFTNEMEGDEDILDLKELRAAEKKIMNAVDKNGWVAVTGDVGSGKSTLLKKIESRLSKRRDVALVKPRIIEKQYLGASHVCDSILQDLGSMTSLTHRTLEYKARLVGRTLEEAYRDGRKVVILLDEAHLLRSEALLALKRIYEFEIGFKKLLAIVLVGQVRLARELKGNLDLREVSQRVDLFELGGLNGQIAAYLTHKLERAGLNGTSADIFDKSALKVFIEHGADTPLSVNNLAAASMIAARDLGEKSVTGEIVKSIPGTF